MNLKETYNKIAEDWHKQHKDDDWWVEGTDKFISFLKPNDLVFDVGCGGGTKSKYLINKGLKVFGIDFSEKMIEIAKREAPEAKFLAMDVKDLVNLDREFDGILAQAILLHIPKKEIPAVLKTLISKLKPDGYLYVAVKETKPGQNEEEVKTEDDLGYKYQRFFSYFIPDEIKKYLIDSGLKIVYENILSGQRSATKTRWIQIIGQK